MEFTFKCGVLRQSLLWIVSITSSFVVMAADHYDAPRRQLLDEIARDAVQTRFATGIRQFSPATMNALASTLRHEFVDDHLIKHAYENRPLPIGYGQTISQPYIVALMTELAKTDKTHIVLEIGTGSGYQAAVLSPLAKSIYSIEIIDALTKSAHDRLQRLGYKNITVKTGDGYYGWEQHAPFDTIIVTAASSHVPPPLIKQLKPGGRMVIPVGGPFFTQQLMLITKELDNTVKTRQILPVSFVPLTGRHPETQSR